MQKALIITIIFLTGIIDFAAAQVQPGNFKLQELKDNALNVSAESPGEKFMKDVNAKPKEKSPYLGALFSGIIPGTGEFYAGSYLKGAIFLAIEAGLWTAYAVYENKGDDQTEVFQNYANENWSINQYAQWLVNQQFTGYTAITDPNNPDHSQLRLQINEVERQNFSHQLPPIGDQQYYELIGKYQNFVAGWKDADLNVVNKFNYGTYVTYMYDYYASEHQQANDYYDMASTSSIFIVVNHLLSAADAAWSVSMFNKELRMKSNVRMHSKLAPDYSRVVTPVVNLSVTF